MTLGYTCTNESLDAIIYGMQLSRGDSILAVLGSGDQAFAMIEYANSVLAVDNNPAQVKFALERKALLEAGNFYGFLEHLAGTGTKDYLMEIHKLDRDAYFTPERMESIRRNLDKLEIWEGDIFRQEGKFSRIYLSNVLRYTKKGKAKRGIRKLAGTLEKKGVLYIADQFDIHREGNTKGFESFEEDEALSAEAYKLHWHAMWRPAVYRRAQ
ncbi:MAG: hypothetical protein WC852_04650 [Candidatus Nanoarchaeia archaeon]|jgi:hypothetical protein